MMALRLFWSDLHYAHIMQVNRYCQLLVKGSQIFSCEQVSDSCLGRCSIAERLPADRDVDNRVLVTIRMPAPYSQSPAKRAPSKRTPSKRTFLLSAQNATKWVIYPEIIQPL